MFNLIIGTTSESWPGNFQNARSQTLSLGYAGLWLKQHSKPWLSVCSTGGCTDAKTSLASTFVVTLHLLPGMSCSTQQRTKSQRVITSRSLTHRVLKQNCDATRTVQREHITDTLSFYQQLVSLPRAEPSWEPPASCGHDQQLFLCIQERLFLPERGLAAWHVRRGELDVHVCLGVGGEPCWRLKEGNRSNSVSSNIQAAHHSKYDKKVQEQV